MAQVGGATPVQMVTQGPRLLEHSLYHPLYDCPHLHCTVSCRHSQWEGEERTPRAGDFLLSKSIEVKIGCIIFANTLAKILGKSSLELGGHVPERGR